jgi:hypothetical protein
MLAEGLAELKAAEASNSLDAAVEDLLQGAGVETGDQAGAITAGLRVFNPLGLANPRAVITTTAGEVTAEIFLDQMPLTSSNFVDLAASGFYDGTHIHRVRCVSRARVFMQQTAHTNTPLVLAASTSVWTPRQSTVAHSS